MTVLQPGQMLGQYQITSQIGKGGMATVYKAYQASMDRYVALKVVSGQVMDDPNFLKRFTQEARLIAKLEHPHILPVHDFGEADGIPYMVMRFLEAGTLTEKLELGQLSLPEIDRIFSQLTDALGYAHENGVIHRDIKPSNAMLDKRGDVFLTDFGIAKMVEGSAGLTATGAITGTPSYMSPEQAQGNKVDQHSDIYSLGVVLFEMLTGRVPFEAETPMAVLFKQILDPPPPLSTVRPDLPYTLEIVLLRALSKKVEDRYPTMGAFRTAWKNALAEADSAAPSQQPVQPVSVPAAKTAVLEPPAAVSTVQIAPAKKGFNWIIAIGGIAVCLVAFCGLAALLLAPRLFGPNPQTQAGTTATAQLVNTPVIIVNTPALNQKSADKGTKSWAAANAVLSIAFRSNEVLAAGMGGITLWNRDDRTYKQLTTANGLASANVSAIFADNDGSLWVGSDAGLTHLQDGKATVYTADQGLDSNAVTVIARSGELLLVGTQYAGNDGGGLQSFSNGTWKKLSGFPSASDPNEKSVSLNIRQIAADKLGNLWVATESGIAMLDAKQHWTVFKTAAGLTDNSVYAIYINKAGNVLAATANGNVAQFNFQQGVFESYVDLKDLNIYDLCCMLEAPDGSLWFAGDNVARYAPATKEWTRFNADDGSFPFHSIRSMGMDDKGVLYFGSAENGLARYVNGEFEKLQVLNAPHYGQYGHIIPAPDGKLIFVQRDENGADQFDPAAGSWTKIPQDQPVPRAFDAKGQMWSAGYDGLWIFGADNPTHITKEHGLPSEQISGIAFNPDGTAYVGTSAGLVLFDGTHVKEVYTVAKNGLISDQILTLFRASDGSLWVSQSGGFSRRLPDGSWKHFTSENLFHGFSQYFPAFVEDHDGNIWVTTDGDGLYMFSKKGEWKRMLSTDPGVGLPSNNLNAIAIAPDGAIWMGTNAGAVRYDGKTWQRYGVKDGLLHNSINGIYVEPGGAIWFATSGGITRLEP